MGSVMVGWKGRCRDRARQDDLLVEIGALAEHSAALLRELQPPKPAFLDVLHRQRAAEVPVEPAVRYNLPPLEVQGTILVDFSVVRDGDPELAEAQRRGVPPAVSYPDGGPPCLWQLDRLTVAGIDFELYDPRGLYPGENRMSFLFVRDGGTPLLDGCLVAVHDHRWCELCGSQNGSATLRNADWYVGSPDLHLRYHLEEWSDLLFAWIKYFYMPDLYFWRYEDLPGWNEFQATCDEKLRDEDMERDVLQRAIRSTLLKGFEFEAEQWRDFVRSLTQGAEAESAEG